MQTPVTDRLRGSCDPPCLPPSVHLPEQATSPVVLRGVDAGAGTEAEGTLADAGDANQDMISAADFELGMVFSSCSGCHK